MGFRPVHLCLLLLFPLIQQVTVKFFFLRVSLPSQLTAGEGKEMWVLATALGPSFQTSVYTGPGGNGLMDFLACCNFSLSFLLNCPSISRQMIVRSTNNPKKCQAVHVCTENQM